MKKLLSILLLVALCVSATFVLVSCKKEAIDYVAQHQLDTKSPTAKMSVTVKYYIDGDTTHFNVPSSLSGQFAQGILKARYLAVDTPESTGVIEEYGKQASNFTHDALASVDANDSEGIILESDTGTWNADSTGERYLVWVWYRTSATEPYRLLNLELLQTGLARGKNLDGLRYTNICKKANNQAIDMKFKVFSGQPDPLFFYGDAYDVTIKAMRLNPEKYAGTDVCFEGIVSKRYNQGVYVEEYDEEDKMYYGVYIFFGYGFSGIRVLQEGNRMRFYGSATNSENYGFQVSNIKYDPYVDDPDEKKKYIEVLSTGNEVPFTLMDIPTFNSEKTIVVDDEEKTFKLSELALKTSVTFENLTVKSIYTTKNEESKSKGAMTLTCQDVAGNEITIRTEVLYEDDKAINPMVTASKYQGKTIDVHGIVDYYKQDDEHEGIYQVRVFSVYEIVVK